MNPPGSAERHYVLSLRAFGTLGHGHFDLLTFTQGAPTFCHDCAVVYEHILAARLLNETEAFLIIEPLDGTFYLLCHITLLKQIAMPGETHERDVDLDSSRALNRETGTQVRRIITRKEKIAYARTSVYARAKRHSRVHCERRFKFN